MPDAPPLSLLCLRRLDAAAPLLLVLLALLAVPFLLRNGGPGVGWDEPFYVTAAAIQAGPVPADARPPEPWRLNAEHPPLAKMLMGVGQWLWLLGGGRGPDTLLLGARAASLTLGGLLLAAVWLLARPLGPAGAGTAVLFCLACPRLTGEAHLASLDLPLTCFWAWTVLACSRADGSRRWTAAACVLFACAFLVKFSAIALLPAVAIARLATAPRGARLRALLLPAGMALVAFVALPVAWPWLWEATGPRLAEYLQRQLGHAMAPVLYFGRLCGSNWNHEAPPWHYAPVLLSLTTPLLVTAGALLALTRLRPAELRPELLFAATAALPVISMLPGGVAYDGIRLFLPTVPLLCILAAGGWTGLAAKRPGLRLTPLLLAAAAALFPPLAVTNALASHTLAIGGPAGAQALGLETAYWGTGLDRQAIARGARQSTPDGTPRRVRFIGFGEHSYGAFLQSLGWLPTGWEATDPADETADETWISDRRSLASVREALTSPGTRFAPLATARVWPAPAVPIAWRREACPPPDRR